MRGINVGRKYRIPMAALKALLEEWGCTQDETLLSSENVLYEWVKPWDDAVISAELSNHKTAGKILKRAE